MAIRVINRESKNESRGNTAIYSVAFDIEVPSNYNEAAVEEAIKLAIRHESDRRVTVMRDIGYMEVHRHDN